MVIVMLGSIVSWHPVVVHVIVQDIGMLELVRDVKQSTCLGVKAVGVHVNVEKVVEKVVYKVLENDSEEASEVLEA